MDRGVAVTWSRTEWVAIKVARSRRPTRSWAGTRLVPPAALTKRHEHQRPQRRPWAQRPRPSLARLRKDRSSPSHARLRTPGFERVQLLRRETLGSCRLRQRASRRVWPSTGLRPRARPGRRTSPPPPNTLPTSSPSTTATTSSTALNPPSTGPVSATRSTSQEPPPRVFLAVVVDVLGIRPLLAGTAGAVPCGRVFLITFSAIVPRHRGCSSRGRFCSAESPDSPSQA